MSEPGQGFVAIPSSGARRRAPPVPGALPRLGSGPRHGAPASRRCRPARKVRFRPDSRGPVIR